VTVAGRTRREAGGVLSLLNEASSSVQARSTRALKASHLSLPAALASSTFDRATSYFAFSSTMRLR